MSDDKDQDKGKDNLASLGGQARAASLTREERRRIASEAAKARWAAQKPIHATHMGNFKADFGIDVDCYVLDDEQKTAVISKRGMGAALGLGHGGRRVLDFVQGKRMADYAGRELSEKLDNPLIFKSLVAGANGPPQGTVVHGYDAALLIDICKAIIKADGDGHLLPRQRNIVRQANVLLGAAGKAGIKNLVYALAGYDATRAEIIAAFKLYVQEEARQWEKEFPDQLYKEWYRLYQLEKPEKNRPWKFRALTINHVYKPLAKSNGKILHLTRGARIQAAAPSKKLHQFLSEIGVKALRTHLGQLLGIAQVSKDQAQYEHHVEKVFSAQMVFEFPAN